MIPFFSFLKALPELVGAFRELVRLIELGNREINSKKRMREIRDAIKSANETKDTTKLDDFFNP